MAGIPSAPTGKSHLSSAVGRDEGDTSVSQSQFQTYTVKKADVPAILAMLTKKDTSQKAGTAPDFSDTIVTVRSYDDRSITAAETTHSLKYRSDLPRTDAFGLKVDNGRDEEIEEDIDTGSVSGEWDTKSDFSTDDELDLDRYETRSEGSGFDDDFGLDVDDEDWDDDEQPTDEAPGSTSSQSSIKERLSNALEKVKTLRKKITDWIISVPQKVSRKLPRKAADSMVLHAPSPKALKERITGKVADASPRMQDLSRQAQQEVHHLSKPGGDSEYAEVDQLAQVKLRISETTQRLDELRNEREDLMKAFDADNAVEQLDAINHEKSVLTSDLKSYKTAEKMLQDMRKPVASQVQQDRLAAENNAYGGKVKEYRDHSKALFQKLKKRDKEYAKLKSSLKEDIQQKQRSIKQLKSEIKTLEKTLKQIDKDVPSPDGNIIHVENGVAYHYDELRSELKNLEQRLQSEETVLLNTKNNIKKKKEQLTAVKEEQSALRQQMRKDKSEHQRALSVINTLPKK